MPVNADVIEDWVARYDNGNNFHDVAEALAIDTKGNVYVTGWSQDPETYDDYATVKYDAEGNQEWVARYNAGSSDIAEAIAVDASGEAVIPDKGF